MGNVVAATPSGFGSTAGPGGKTGITHGTRLISLNTTPAIRIALNREKAKNHLTPT